LFSPSSVSTVQPFSRKKGQAVPFPWRTMRRGICRLSRCYSRPILSDRPVFRMPLFGRKIILYPLNTRVEIVSRHIDPRTSLAKPLASVSSCLDPDALAFVSGCGSMSECCFQCHLPMALPLLEFSVHSCNSILIGDSLLRYIRQSRHAFSYQPPAVGRTGRKLNDPHAAHAKPQ